MNEKQPLKNWPEYGNGQGLPFNLSDQANIVPDSLLEDKCNFIIGAIQVGLFGQKASAPIK
jgi:hypothetical protein